MSKDYRNLSNVAVNGDLHGYKVSPSAPAITHLLFVNDSFLFFKDMKEEAITVKAMLNTYEKLSQVVNF